MNIYQVCIIGFSISLFFSMVIYYTKNLHGKITFDNFDGVQKFHVYPTPRIGGLAIILSILFILLFVSENENNFIKILIFSSIPIFISGFAEDTTKIGGTKIRLFASLLTSITFIYISGYKISNIDVIGFDTLLSYPIFSILFTCFSIMGIINSINIIDGFNGLASGTVILILLSFSYIFFQLGDTEFFNISVILVFIYLGFFLVNFPKGLLFLGDAGAYLSGFIVASIAIMLPIRHPDISPWVSLLICSYPVIETIFSMIRKTKREKHSMINPDRVHLHMLIYRSISNIISKKLYQQQFRNAITSLIILGFPLLSGFLAILFYRNLLLTFLSTTLIIILYLSLYKKVSLNWQKK